jgi:hypothetical protein
MTLNIPLKCTCGALQGMALVDSESKGSRSVCYCDDCQAYAHYLGRPQDILDVNGGTDIFPATPANLKITQGIENLKVLRLTDKGMLRWYAGCCWTPIANTMVSAKIPFAGLMPTFIDLAPDEETRSAVLGPVYFRVMGKFGIGKLPSGTSRVVSPGFLFKNLKFMFKAWSKGQHQPSPFLDAKSGKPKVQPYILTAAERAGLRKLCGPVQSKS